MFLGQAWCFRGHLGEQAAFQNLRELLSAASLPCISTHTRVTKHCRTECMVSTWFVPIPRMLCAAVFLNVIL